MLTNSSIWYYHGLRGSASPVLTATGFVNGRGQILTPTESTPLNRSPKNLLLVITSATPTAVPNLVQIRPRRGFWANRWNITKILLFIPFFHRTRRRIFTPDGSNDADSRKDVPFGSFVDIAPHYGGKIPQKTIFGAWIVVFKPNRQNIESFMLSKLLHRF